MDIKSVVPNTFYNDELLDPNKVNDNNQYMIDAIRDTQSRRYAHSVVILPLYMGASALTQANNQATRSYLIPAIDDMYIERMYLDGSLASGAATVVIYNATTGTTAPAGAVNPIFTPTTTDTTLSYLQPIYMAAGSTYRIEITGTTFSTSKLDLIIHFRTDKLNVDGADQSVFPSVQQFVEADAVSATTFNSNTNAITSAVGTLNTYTRALRVHAYTWTDFNNGSSANTLRASLPRGTTTLMSEESYRMVSVVSMSAAGSALQQVICSVTNASGGSIGISNIHSVSGLTESQATDTTQVTIGTSTANAISDSANDYRMTVSNSAATTATKATIWLYFY